MFIEVTDVHVDLKILINVNHIVTVWQMNDKSCCSITTTSQNNIEVEETYEEVLKLMGVIQ